MTDHERFRHDFRNQLAIIRGFSEILIAEAPSDHPFRRDFEEIHKAAGTALELLESIFPSHADVRP
jgi:signal transduction histidine kinase